MGEEGGRVKGGLARMGFRPVNMTAEDMLEEDDGYLIDKREDGCDRVVGGCCVNKEDQFCTVYFVVGILIRILILILVVMVKIFFFFKGMTQG